MKHRLMLSSPDAALRLNRCTGLIELRLPVGFHSLPIPEQERAINEAAAEAVAEALDTIRNRAFRRSA